MKPANMKAKPRKIIIINDSNRKNKMLSSNSQSNEFNA